MAAVNCEARRKRMKQAERTKPPDPGHEQQTFQNLGDVDAVDGGNLLVGLQNSVTRHAAGLPVRWSGSRIVVVVVRGFAL